MERTINVDCLEQVLGCLKEWGFNVCNYYKRCNTIHEILDYIDSFDSKRHMLPYITDGIVNQS